MNSERIEQQRRSFDAVPFAASAARSFIASTLREIGLAARDIDDFRLVISELVANIIEHGDGSGFEVFVDEDHADRWVVGVACAVAAAGTSLPDPAVWAVADADEASGRGLGIVRALMDDVSVETIDGEVIIRCSLYRHHG